MNLESIKSKTAQMIMQFSVPSILAMVLSALVTVVDGFFIGNYIGGEGIAAVNLGLPILYVFLAVGIMIGVGGVAISGIKLGAGEIEESISVFNQTALTTTIASVLITVLSLVALQPIISALHMDPLVATHFKSYYPIMVFVYPIMMLNASLGMFVRCEGKH